MHWHWLHCPFIHSFIQTNIHVRSASVNAEGNVTGVKFGVTGLGTRDGGWGVGQGERKLVPSKETCWVPKGTRGEALCFEGENLSVDGHVLQELALSISDLRVLSDPRF